MGKSGSQQQLSDPLVSGTTMCKWTSQMTDDPKQKNVNDNPGQGDQPEVTDV